MLCHPSSLSRQQSPTGRRERPRCQSAHHERCWFARAQSPGETHQGCLRQMLLVIPKPPREISMDEVREKSHARKRRQMRQARRNLQNVRSCGRGNGSAGTGALKSCRTEHAGSSSARCRCARRKMCQWKKAPARRARPASGSTPASSARMRQALVVARQVMTKWVLPIPACSSGLHA